MVQIKFLYHKYCLSHLSPTNTCGVLFYAKRDVVSYKHCKFHYFNYKNIFILSKMVKVELQNQKYFLPQFSKYRKLHYIYLLL